MWSEKKMAMKWEPGVQQILQGSFGSPGSHRDPDPFLGRKARGGNCHGVYFMSIWKPMRQGFFGPIRGETPGKGPRPPEVGNISSRVILRRFSLAQERATPPRDSSSSEKGKPFSSPPLLLLGFLLSSSSRVSASSSSPVSALASQAPKGRWCRGSLGNDGEATRRQRRRIAGDRGKIQGGTTHRLGDLFSVSVGLGLITSGPTKSTASHPTHVAYCYSSRHAAVRCSETLRRPLLPPLTCLSVPPPLLYSMPASWFAVVAFRARPIPPEPLRKT
uniref:Uncharacterized protein n=1 Tax=Oryza barthii TaxID=65489 RepID=A0A0D3F6A6_9ORYZ